MKGPVYCDECTYLSQQQMPRLDGCHAPPNYEDIVHPGGSQAGRWVRHPREINHHNDCAWFKPKGDESHWRHRPIQRKEDQ